MENPILVDAHTHSHLKPHLQLKTGPILPSLTSAAVSKVTTHCTIGAKLFWFSIRLQISHQLKIAQPLSKNPSERQRERFVVALMRAVVIGISLCLFCLGGESQLKKKNTVTSWVVEDELKFYRLSEDNPRWCWCYLCAASAATALQSTWKPQHAEKAATRRTLKAQSFSWGKIFVLQNIYIWRPSQILIIS